MYEEKLMYFVDLSLEWYVGSDILVSRSDLRSTLRRVSWLTCAADAGVLVADRREE